MTSPGVSLARNIALVGLACLLSAGCAKAATSGPSPGSAAQPPGWLLTKMQGRAHEYGDPHVSVWWTLATEGKTAFYRPTKHPDKAVYFVLFKGTFKYWPYTLNPGVTPAPFRWAAELFDADSHATVQATLAWTRPDTSGLHLSQASLTPQ
jgi:hypothetical protein